MYKSYIKIILSRIDTIVIIMPRQRFSLKHHIMKNWNKVSFQMTATVTGICLKDIAISLQWESSVGQAHRYILYTNFSHNAYIFTWWRKCTSALLYSVNINYETLMKLHIHLRTGPGTHICIYFCMFYYFWGL